jgi:RNA polymerase sigma-70 factor (ECF subfamily)
VFYRAHHRSLAAYALSLTRSREEAEDLVHEVLAGMLAAPHNIGEPEAYAYRSIRNRAIDRVRRLPLVQIAQTVRRDSAASKDATEQDARTDELLCALESLAPSAAEVVVLHTRAGLSFPQIASILGEPLGTISARYSRALAELRALLMKEEPHG